MSAIGWRFDVWEESTGLRIATDPESGTGTFAEVGLLLTREEAYQHDLLDHCTHGDSSAHVDVTKLDPECEVYLFGLLIAREDLIRYLRQAVALLESTA